MATKNLSGAAADLSKMAEQFPSQAVKGRAPPKPEPSINDPLKPYQFSMRESLKRELSSLAAGAGMTMQAFILNALKEKGLSVTEDDLIDRRRK